MSDERLCIECLRANARTAAVGLCVGPSPVHRERTCDRGVCQAHATPAPGKPGKVLCPMCAKLPPPAAGRDEGMLW